MSPKRFLRLISISLLALSGPIYSASAPGIQNFDQVDDHVYRGAQPTDDGIRYLADLGVKLVLDLRETDQPAEVEKRMVKAAGMRYVNVPMTGLTPPSDAEITKILELLQDSTAGPVFVHCKRGADRTGAVIAAYLMNFHKWSNERALKDAKAHGMGRFQFPRQNYIRTFQPRPINLRQLVEKAEAGSSANPISTTAIPYSSESSDAPDPLPGVGPAKAVR